MRDDDALLGEVMSDAELAAARAAGMRHPVGVVDCPECGTAGTVTDGRFAEIEAESRAAVMRALERLYCEHPELTL